MTATQVSHRTRGFSQPVHQSQLAFHAAMMALARPGLPQALAPAAEPPAPMSAGVAGLAMALCDFETSIWLDRAFTQASDIADYLRFHTGARIVASPSEASFALIGAPGPMPRFDQFARGTLDYPDRSTTLILQLDRVMNEGRFALEGPGIEGRNTFDASPLPADFHERMKENRALFPRGVDILMIAGDAVIGLPRSSTLHRLSEA